MSSGERRYEIRWRFVSETVAIAERVPNRMSNPDPVAFIDVPPEKLSRVVVALEAIFDE